MHCEAAAATAGQPTPQASFWPWTQHTLGPSLPGHPPKQKLKASKGSGEATGRESQDSTGKQVPGTCLPAVDENPEGPGGGENLLQGQTKNQHSPLRSQTDVLYPGTFAHEIQTILGGLWVK